MADLEAGKRLELQLQVYLEEFKALRAEAAESYRRRENINIVSLAIAGAILSFSFSGSAEVDELQFRQVAILLVPPLSLQLAALGYIHILQGRRVRTYLEFSLITRINRLLSNPPRDRFQAMLWVRTSFLNVSKFERAGRVMTNGVFFLAPGIVSQLLFSELTMVEGLRVAYRYVYWANWGLLSAATIVLVAFEVRRFGGKRPGPAQWKAAS